MPDRIQLRRTKGWRKPPRAIVVSRSTMFGNPWKPGPGTDHFWWPEGPARGLWRSAHPIPRGPLTAAESVEMFEAWMHGYAIPHDWRPAMLSREGQRACWDALSIRRTEIYQALPSLRGHSLACWCPLDRPCHADVLLEIANG